MKPKTLHGKHSGIIILRDGDEHYLLHIMRNHPKFVPELDIVAEHNNKIVGNVVCLKSFIMADDGNQYEVLSLGPISVLPEYQQQGIGGRMIALTKKISFRNGISCYFTLW